MDGCIDAGATPGLALESGLGDTTAGMDGDAVAAVVADGDASIDGATETDGIADGDAVPVPSVASGDGLSDTAGVGRPLAVAGGLTLAVGAGVGRGEGVVPPDRQAVTTTTAAAARATRRSGGLARLPVRTGWSQGALRGSARRPATTRTRPRRR